MNYPKVGSDNSVRGDGWPLIVNGQLDQSRISKLARWDDVVLDLACINAHPEIEQALRSVNPSIHLQAYVVTQAYVWSGLPFFKDFTNAVSSTNGYVYMEGGDTMWWFTNVNMSNTATVDAIAKVIQFYSAGWDALWLDILIPQLISAQQGNPNGQMEVIDWRRMGYASEGDFLHAWPIGVNRLMAQLQGKPIYTNYGHGHPLGNGHTCENFPKIDGTWEKAMDGLWHAPHDDPKASWICSEFAGYDPMTPENLRRHRWGLGSACLCDSWHSFGRYEWDDHWCEARLDFWYPEYQHPQLGKGWLGATTSPAAHVTRQKNKTVDLWTRYFERGVVVVNPSTKAHSIYFDRPYKPINGAGKTGWSVPAQDALIMEVA